MSLENLTVDVEALDRTGAQISKDKIQGPCLVYVRLVSVLTPEESGAVAVGDTLVYQPLAAEAAAYLFLTSDGCAPYFRAWAGPGAEDFYAWRMTRSIMDGQTAADLELGRAVGGTIGGANVLLPNRLYPVLSGQLRLFECGKWLGHA